MNKQILKSKISFILIEAINGSSNKYKLKNGVIDWEQVEKDIYQLIDDI